MNSKRRAMLRRAKSLLTESSEIVNNVLSEEEDSMSNIPENLQESQRYMTMENIIDRLEDATGYLDDADEALEDALAQ